MILFKNELYGEANIMIKKGFTLTELLITLGIIGVVAALTAPALNINANNAKPGPALAKAVSTLEEANLQLIANASVSGLENISNTTLGYMDALSTRISGSSYESAALTADDFTPSVTTFSGNEMSLEGTTLFKLPNNIDLLVQKTEQIEPPGEQNRFQQWLEHEQQLNEHFNDSDESSPQARPMRSYNAQGSYTGVFAVLYIDINGINNKPNALGKDIFAFLIDNSGLTIPVGGKTYAWLYGSDNNRWDKDGTFACNATTVNTGEGCAGSIFDNNLKVIYQ